MLTSEAVLLLAGISSCLGDYAGSFYYDGYEFASWVDSVAFLEAMVKCETHINPGYLSEPKTEELMLAADYANSMHVNSWLGATDEAAENRWLWLDTSKLTYTNWQPGEPNNKNNEDCLMMVGTGEWNDADCCTANQGYICQIPDSARSRFGHSNFEIVRLPGTFRQAKQACAAKGARLVEVTDQETEKLREIVNFGKQPLWVAKAGSKTSECLTVNEDGVEESDCSVLKPAFLCEKVGPYALKASQEKVSASVGSRVEVDCAAKGYPTPDVAWYKDGVEVVTQIKSIGTSRLVVESVTADDAGHYLCHATNAVTKGKFEVRTMTEVITEE